MPAYVSATSLANAIADAAENLDLIFDDYRRRGLGRHSLYEPIRAMRKTMIASRNEFDSMHEDTRISADENLSITTWLLGMFLWEPEGQHMAGTAALRIALPTTTAIIIDGA